jgi:hypothetical protein
MAARSTSARRLRWLVLVGLAGVGVWAVRSRRAGQVGLLERWPDSPSVPAAPPVPPRAAEPTGGSAPAGRSEQVEAADGPEPTPSTATPPPEEPTASLGVPVPSTAADAVEDPAIGATAPPGEDSAAETSSEPSPPPAGQGEPAPPTPSPAEPDEPLIGANPLFAPPRQAEADTGPAAAEPVRPSPTPRPRAAAAQLVVGSGAARALPDGSAPGPEYTIKGNADSMLFHRPDSPYYSRTKAEIWFRTATDARAAGFTEYSRNRTKDRLADT